ncbi:MAG TPA: diguanylate cyclase [Polyangiaceae bacterium]|nr:diguanylate cyclase [Polyangiaceae bacterium]
MARGVPESVRRSAAPPERPGRIAVVDPDPTRRETLRTLLEREGFEVVVVDAPAELGRADAERRLDLVIASADVPGRTVTDIVGDLRNGDTLAQPLVILVGRSADDRSVAEGLAAGADDYVADVERPLELLARVRLQLRNRRMLDVLQRVRSERDLLQKDAQIDPLTGVLNRRSLERAMNERCQGRSRFGVLFMDIDHFKSINDLYGHDVGDRVLAVIAGSLRSALRPEDTVGRYGGEEFVALIADAGLESARLVAERLRQQIESLTPEERGPERTTLSVGCTVFDPHKRRDSSEDLLRRADAALYAAKRSGRNRVVALPIDASPESLLEGTSTPVPRASESRALAAAWEKKA